MQVLTAEQLKAWDAYTIAHEPVSSLDLMERAANRCVDWVKTYFSPSQRFYVFCGKGNNGGDGLAMARRLLQAGFSVEVHVYESGRKGSLDFEQNLQRLAESHSSCIHFLHHETELPLLQQNDLIVDALLGTGLNNPLEGLVATLVEHIHASGATVISIDLPTGLFADKSSAGQAVVKASYTLTFQCYKTALLMQENAAYIGAVEVLDIGLHPVFLQQIHPAAQLLDEKRIRSLYRPRSRFAHKGSFGHALLAGGSLGKMGAMVLATRACLLAGAGLTTALIPRCGYTILQTAAPEAMTLTDDSEAYLTRLPDEIDRFDAIGLGPGMGTKEETQTLLSFFIRRYRKPLVIDADGLNCLAKNKELLSQLPAKSLLTPHPKEFDRIAGEHQNDFDRMATAKALATKLNLIIILKSHHTLIATPLGHCYFNTTGNAGMAKGGSGDVLTGILTALLAQGYAPEAAAQLGIYLHGRAGDVAAKIYSPESMLPSQLSECLAAVFRSLART